MESRGRASTPTVSKLARRAITFIGWIVASFVAASAVITIVRAATPNASQTSNPAGKLGIWEGRWTYNERDYEKPYSYANTNSGTGDCSRPPNRGFMVCDYLNSNPGNGVSANDLAVFSYSSSAHTYARLGIFKTPSHLQKNFP
jgi:hypothetical protein